MKNISILFLLSLLLVSCYKDALETQPNDRYTEDTYWTSEKTAMAGLTGCYQVLTSNSLYGYATPLWEETATPNAYNYDNSAGFGLIALGTHTATNAGAGNIVSGVIEFRWKDCYRGIGRCNTLLDRINAVPMADVLKDRMKAEAKFLRGLYYSILATYYGGVPLILTPPNFDQDAKLPRNSRAEVVQQVVKDMDEAAMVLPPKFTGNDIGRATSGAALAIKARMLLFEASPLNNPSGDLTKWVAAANAAKAIIDLPGTGYGLFPNYRQLFLPANENKQETVFDVQYTISTTGFGNSFDLINRLYNTNAPLRDLINAYDMKDGLPPAQSPLYDALKPYDNRDPRMYQTIIYPGDTYLGAPVTTATFKQTGYGVKKYGIYDKEAVAAADLINSAGRSQINYMVVRYADVLLMYAEAQNEVLGAPDVTVRNAVELVRQRAGLVPYQVSATLTKPQMRELIRHERRIEFACEGFYYTDIRRWKTAEQVLTGPIFNSQNQQIVTRNFNPLRDYWWPIAQTQRELNPNLEQNDNY
ncbi:RagB/SusD family nutrient uptake outer membrane protein [Pedobacter heparinus]|uniref:RagB/SusD domain protein n=1 Tax=Pedobacter heparinus (strain ATCC 13125 / DSM 2366 / CIP 104194 / JCM 7457 / NBRC 12017 / NCIMB 9290 / NRRL B-14731 / HIM 762-3) TaxID=485917 RepID=C6XXS6_PEDHD|nr:RagB/SusD family nutrient uptake outer membrane protein [Pedobacter heparinus]ACU04344.1 RagB/SusD domain protein [Pedobacter heparinus DSM 2366]